MFRTFGNVFQLVQVHSACKADLEMALQWSHWSLCQVVKVVVGSRMTSLVDSGLLLW